VQGQGSSEQDGGYGALDILDASQDCAWILRLDGGVEHANHLAQAMFTADPDDPAAWREIWPEESRFSLDRAFDIAAAGQVARFRAFLGDAQRRIYCDTTISPMRDRTGAVIRLLACARDVTDAVETHGFLKTVIQLLPSPLTVKNVEDGRYVLINRAAEDAFGLVADDAVGKTAPEVMPRAIARTLIDIEARVLRTGEMQVAEKEFGRGPDAAPRYFLTKTLATYDDIGARHLITLGDDVTASKRAKASLRAALDQAEQASQAKSAFLANMSHEIRTPLNGIVAGADLLAKGELTPRARELVEIIVNSGRSLERLLSDILDLVRIEAGRWSSRPTLRPGRPDPVGQRPVRPARRGKRRPARDSHRSGRRQGRARRRRAAAPGADQPDEQRGQVHRPRPGDPERRARANGGVRFSVRDTGIGFDAAEKSRIFERFQQADASFTRRFGGTGLGLAISRELVELMGGDLSCDSVPGEGSTFWFTLPLPVHRDAPVETTTDGAPDTPDMPRVLVADDHPTNRKIVELMLAEVAEIFTAENGRDAVDLCATITPDLILMDMQMPVMDGLDAVREIRSREAATGAARTPIIMLTANARPEHVRASREAGADLHLEKPITSAMLFAAIGQAFEAAQGAPEALAAEA
jgi:signal transduction histidine kinase/CheY-like chemotaxis protein